MRFEFNSIKDEDLYEMCKRGEEEAWQYIYNYIAFICKQTGMKDEDDRKDMAQSIILNLLDSGIAKCRKKESFKKFLKIMTINRVIDSYRRDKHNITDYERRKYRLKTEPHGDVNTDNDFFMNLKDDPKDDDPVYFDELMHLVQKTLNQMPRQCKKLLSTYFQYKLGYIEDYKRLSRILHLPSGTISAQVTRCLRKFIKYKEITELYEGEHV